MYVTFVYSWGIWLKSVVMSGSESCFNRVSVATDSDLMLVEAYLNVGRICV